MKSIFHILSVCFSLRHPACKVHTPHHHLSYLALPHFSTYLIKGMGGGELYIKCVFSFSLQILSATFPILTRTEQDVIINVQHISSCEICYSCMKLEFSCKIFKKYFNIKLYKNLSSCSMRMVGWMDGWTGRHVEANCCFAILKTRLKNELTKVSYESVIVN